MSEQASPLDQTGMLRQLAILGYSIYTTTMVGDPAPFVRRLAERMRAPRPGDLVLETSTVFRLDRGDWDSAALGYFLREADEPACTREEWDAEQAEEAAWCAEHHPGEPFEPEPYEPRIERVQYLQRLDDGGEFRWHNAEFIALPTTLPRAWLGETPPGSTVTRDSLIADLGDAGFHLKDQAQ